MSGSGAKRWPNSIDIEYGSFKVLNWFIVYVWTYNLKKSVSLLYGYHVWGFTDLWEWVQIGRTWRNSALPIHWKPLHKTEKLHKPNNFRCCFDTLLSVLRKPLALHSRSVVCAYVLDFVFHVHLSGFSRFRNNIKKNKVKCTFLRMISDQQN